MASRGAGQVDTFAIRRCAGCGTLFTARLPAAGEAQDYGGYYHAGNLEVPAFVHQRLAEIVASFDHIRRRNRWLDVGSGAGTLLRAARDRGWDAVGTEVAETAARAARAAGLEVLVGDLRDLGLPEGSFDIVSVVEVAEHVTDPGGLLAAAAPLLRPGGVLYLTTPHGRGISARFLGARWSAVAPPEHLQLLSVRGLRALLSTAGLEERELRTHAVNPHELLAAARGRGREVGGAARVETGYRLNESLSSRGTGVLVKRMANASLNALRLGDSIKLVAQRPS